MTEEFVHRMGVNASSAPSGDTDNIQYNIAVTDAALPPFRDAMGVIVR